MRIAILTGGKSSEREVALRSAKHLQTWIEKSGYSSVFFDFPQELDQFLE
jgi:D-alanine-D-alanine ligase-like ATP-grasp enzyme